MSHQHGSWTPNLGDNEEIAIGELRRAILRTLAKSLLSSAATSLVSSLHLDTDKTKLSAATRLLIWMTAIMRTEPDITLENLGAFQEKCRKVSSQLLTVPMQELKHLYSAIAIQGYANPDG